MNYDERLRVGISIGDINGIGMEVIIKTFLDNRMLDFCTPVVYGSSKVASAHRKALGITDFSFNVIEDAENANPKRANIINVWDEEVEIELGKVTADGGKYALKSLEAAVQDLASNKVDLLVTAPINKDNIQSPDFNFPGHTEFLANYANVDDYLMLLVAGNIRVGVVTGHIPLKDVSSAISTNLILKKLDVMHRSLVQDFGIRKPRIAVLGLNPHAGDNGLLGTEERDVVTPAIQKANEQGIMAVGPYSADGLFGSKSLGLFDGILAMYHDQGLAPFKAIAFDDGVNYTAGLPVVRTSPDHGTGYDIAGKDKASEQSFRNAVFLAIDIHRKRQEYREITANPLPIKKQKEDRSG